MIYICIPVFNRIAFTIKCIQSIRRQSYKKYKIVICDDGSTDGTSNILATDFPEVIVLKGNGNLWWSGATNECVKYVLSVCEPDDFIFTLNNDTELEDSCLSIISEFADSHQDSLVACGNYFANDTVKIEGTAFVQRNKWPFSLYHGLLFPWGQDVTNLKERIFEVDSVSGKGVLIPIKVFRKVGLYNAEKLPQYHGDQEFSRRAKEQGFRIFLNLNAIVYTDQTASGIGQVNSKISATEFFRSLNSLRSENYIPTLYRRAKIVYKKKWIIYLVFNVVSIHLRFARRYIKACLKVGKY
ncbi:glycosyltransferase family 2 protein [Pedobacter sp. JY14-1]|uniref:glycosyltransferase family 2 protein n=1 Tax=Pedobacter sp. JY14-1 TaxID=3034151 RepID=UPI0023E0DEB4|nr:glycosyltransferase family 2 protein [Pedobacter sp. JY14-1]